MELLRNPEFIYGLVGGAGAMLLLYNLKKDSISKLFSSRKNRNTIFASVVAVIAYVNGEISGEQLVLALGGLFTILNGMIAWEDNSKRNNNDFPSA